MGSAVSLGSVTSSPLRLGGTRSLPVLASSALGPYVAGPSSPPPAPAKPAGSALCSALRVRHPGQPPQLSPASTGQTQSVEGLSRALGAWAGQGLLDRVHTFDAFPSFPGLRAGLGFLISLFSHFCSLPKSRVLVNPEMEGWLLINDSWLWYFLQSVQRPLWPLCPSTWSGRTGRRVQGHEVHQVMATAPSEGPDKGVPRQLRGLRPSR